MDTAIASQFTGTSAGGLGIVCGTATPVADAASGTAAGVGVEAVLTFIPPPRTIRLSALGAGPLEALQHSKSLRLAFLGDCCPGFEDAGRKVVRVVIQQHAWRRAKHRRDFDQPFLRQCHTPDFELLNDRFCGVDGRCHLIKRQVTKLPPSAKVIVLHTYIVRLCTSLVVSP